MVEQFEVKKKNHDPLGFIMKKNVSINEIEPPCFLTLTNIADI